MQHRTRKCLGIDIGALSVKIAELSVEKSGVRVTRLLRAELPPSSGPMDAERSALISRTIKDLVSKNKIATKVGVFCVSGISVFIRRIKVPRTNEERLIKIIQFEAKQQIPFPIEQSVIEFQVFDYGDQSELEVLLVAIKKDAIAEFMKTVNRSGVKPLMVSVSTLALFNFHVFDSTPYNDLQIELGLMKKPELAKPKKAKKALGGFGKKKSAATAAVAAVVEAVEEEEAAAEDSYDSLFEEVRAYLNIGHQYFDLAIAKQGKHKTLGFARSVIYAGSELTRSLQDKLGLESLEAAEQMKRDQSIIIVPGREQEANARGINPDASEFATSWADRVLLDLRKSFDFYIGQPDGAGVDSIMLSGGQALQPNFPAYIEDKLGIPVELKDNFENTALEVPQRPEGEGLSSYLIALGLGLTGVGLGQIQVDFLPGELKSIRDFKRKKVELAVMVAAIAGMVGFSTVIGSKELESMRSWLGANQGKLDAQQRVAKEFETSRNERNAVNERVTALGQALGDRTYTLELIGAIENAKPASVLLQTLQVDAVGNVILSGESESESGINEFIDTLKAKKDWVKPGSVKLLQNEPTSSAAMGKNAQRFALQLTGLGKTTRLDTAKVPLAPGVYTPTPAPTGAAGSKSGPGMFGGGGAPPAGGAAGAVAI